MRKTVVNTIQLLVLLVTASLAIGGCATGGSTPGPSASAGGPSPSASPPASSPSPVASQGSLPSTSPATSPGTSPGAGTPAGLVLRFTWCPDVCVSNPGTTVLEDGRVIWRTESGWVERQLTAGGMAWLRASLDETGALGANAGYTAELRPGAQPAGHGVTSYTFRVVRGSFSVVVTTQDPGAYEGESALWVIPPQMTALAPVARSLQDPGTSFPADAWAGPSVPFSPPGYLLLVDLRAGVGPGTDPAPDVDDVDWPFSIPIDQVGSPFLMNGAVVQNSRCQPISARLASDIAAAEAAAGRPRGLDETLSTLDYGWARGDGTMAVSTQWLMPDQAWSCSASLTW